MARPYKQMVQSYKQLVVKDCRLCTYLGNGPNNPPCNRCFSMNANCIEQHFKDKRAKDDKRPFMGLPLSETELLTVTTDQISEENVRLHKLVTDLMKEVRLLQREVKRLGDHVRYISVKEMNKTQMEMNRAELKMPPPTFRRKEFKW